MRTMLWLAIGMLALAAGTFAFALAAPRPLVFDPTGTVPIAWNTVDLLGVRK